MIDNPPIHEGQLLAGSLFNEPMKVVTVSASGPDTLVAGLVGTQSERFRDVTLTCQDFDSLTVHNSAFTYEGDGLLLRLGLQAYSLGSAYKSDPYFGISISRVDPLRRQLEAIGDYLLKLPRVRSLPRCELDAAYFHLYSIERDDVDYIMEIFPIVKRKDIQEHGTYRTKETILQIHDAMQRAINTGEPYQSLPDPPPGPPTNPDGTFASLPTWRPGDPRPTDWPPHIHPPKLSDSGVDGDA